MIDDSEEKQRLENLRSSAILESMDSAVVDRIIEKLTEVRSSKPGKLVQLTESEIKQLCAASRDIFIKQPNLLELEAPIKICGNPFIH
ncbi:unnamed protein product [Cuscuta campestris]|uniref:protein-serine/threonine phosphatase n=1 Tax=Cuscuta campestris TaxID=132261 RepID=A0A484LXQ2_9ASTE|nr:unnamed protein product [Cuscuta campestris]